MDRSPRRLTNHGTTMNDQQMTIVQVRTEDLKPFAKNAKRHSPEQVEAIARSMESFGFLNPVLVGPDMEIVAGHGRALAAKSLGLEFVPCIVLGHLTAQQRRAYVIADNRLSETGGGWDLDLLRSELEELAEVDLGEFSMDDLEFDQLGIGGVAVDDAKEEWRRGMPEFEHKDRLGIACTVRFDDEAAMHAFEELVGQKIPTNVRSIFFPKKEWISMAGVHYENEEEMLNADRAAEVFAATSQRAHELTADAKAGE
jgi:hypothetical protein